MRRCGFRSARAQRGLAMVELALTLPLLVLLMLAFAEFGRMLFQYNSLQQASRDAGRYAASQAWNATLGTLDLNAALVSQTKNVAVYGLPANPNGYPAAAPVARAMVDLHGGFRKSGSAIARAKTLEPRRFRCWALVAIS